MTKTNLKKLYNLENVLFVEERLRAIKVVDNDTCLTEMIEGYILPAGHAVRK